MTSLNLPARLTPFLMIFLLLVLQGCFHSSNSSSGGVTPTSPVFTSGTAISVAENTTVTGYTAEATDADGDTVTYSLTGGEDQTAFIIDKDSGVLSFNTAADFENPTDSGTNNTYVVEITATDGTNAVVLLLTVTVIDIKVSNGVDPTGYYTNTGFVQVMLADDTTPRTTEADFQGMVTDSQFMMLSDTENLTYVGTFTTDENNFSGSVTLYEAGVMTQEDIPVNGLITEGARITGTLSGTGAANGTFQLDYAPLADNGPVDVAMVIPTLGWSPVNNSESFTINIGDDAAPIPNFGHGGSGQGVFDRCGFQGRIEPIPGVHLYTVSGVMNDCGNTDILMPETYSGLVSVRGIVPNDRLIVILTNGTYGISGEYFQR